MDRRFLTVLGVSLVFALVVSAIFYQLTARAGAPAAAAPDAKEMKDVVVAAKPLSLGGSIKPGDVKVSKVPADQFPKGAFSKVEEVMDRPVVSNILLEEPIIVGRLGERGSGQGIAPIIPVGSRAVTVRVTEVVGVAGFVLPGMRVDVLVTGRPPDSSDTVTTTVLQNIVVLSAGQTYQPDARGQAINANTVTLLVTPEEAELVTLAGNEGRIQLLLRNGSDHSIAKPTGRQLAELYGGRGSGKKRSPQSAGEGSNTEGSVPAPRPRPRPVTVAAAVIAPPAPAVAPPPPPPPPDEIVTFRGTVRAVEVINSRKN
ncbi:MAG: Flp pilus assembly protein CpaB [Bryobacterales bacterium]|nr:Flp pilus assembly protein CpaB [Bryobacterales bacterium]